MYVFCAEGVLILVVFHGEGVAVLADIQGFLGVGVYHPAAASRPPEGAYAQPLNGRDPDASDDVFAVVLVPDVDAFAIEDTDLVMQQVASGLILQEVALKLDADVASRGTLLACAVAIAYEGVDDVGVGIPSLGDGVHGVLEGEGALEFAALDTQPFEFPPLGVEVYEHHGGFAGTLGGGGLYLHSPVEVADLAVEHQTCESQIEIVVIAAFPVLILIL